MNTNMTKYEQVMNAQARMAEWRREQYAQRKLLEEKYPVNKIKNINTKHIRKIGGIMGMYSNHTKREYIHYILHNQDFDNLIITIDDDGIYHLNQDCALIKYFK